MEFHFDFVRIPMIVQAHLKARLSTELNIGLLSRPAASLFLQCTMFIIINVTNIIIIIIVIIVNIVIIVIIIIVIIAIIAIINSIIDIVIITIAMYGIDQSIDHLIYEAPTNKHAPNHTLVQSL